MKKQLIPLTAMALLALASCGPSTSEGSSSTDSSSEDSSSIVSSSEESSVVSSSEESSVVSSSEESSSESSVADVYSITITNKEEMEAAWKVGGDNRDISLSATLNGEPQNILELLNEGDVELTTSDPEVVALQGTVIKAIGGGTATITVTYGDSSDSFTVTVTEPQLYSISALATSEMDKQEVQIRGVVTTVVKGSFVLEDASGAILVYADLPDGVAKGDYVKVCGTTSFYHTTICEIGKGAVVIKLNNADAPETPIISNPVELEGTAYAEDVASIQKEKVETVPDKWNLKYQYVETTGTISKIGGYTAFYPDDVDALWPIEPLSYSADLTGVELEEGITYDMAGYLTWDTKYAYGAFYVNEVSTSETVVTSFELAMDSPNLYIQGDFKQSKLVDCLIEGTNVKDIEIDWVSSNEDVITVENGIVTAVSAGTAVITASYEEFVDDIEITVTQATDAVTGVNLDKTTASGVVGHTFDVTATVTSDGEDFIADVVWGFEGGEDGGSVELVNTDGNTATFKFLTVGTVSVWATTCGLDSDGWSIDSDKVAVTIEALNYGTAEDPLSVSYLLENADLIVPLDSSKYVYSTEKVTVIGVVTKVKQYSDDSWNITIADLDDSTKTIDVTGAGIDLVCVGDTVVLQDNLEASKTKWVFYRTGTARVTVLSCVAGESTLEIEANESVVTGITAGTVTNHSEQTFTVTPNSGYTVDSVKVNGTIIEADDSGNYTFVVTGNTSVVVTTLAEGATYTKLAGYTLAAETAASATEATLLKAFNDNDETGDGLSDIVTAASGLSKVNLGYTGYLNLGLKLGTGSVNGAFTLTLSTKVTRVVVSAIGWTATDTLAVGDADAQTLHGPYNGDGAELKEYTFDITASDSITFTTSKRGFIGAISFYTLSE